MASLAASPGESKDPTPSAINDDDEDVSNYNAPATATVADLIAKDADDVALQKYKASLLGAGVVATDASAPPVEIIELRMLFAGREPLVIPLGATTATSDIVVLKESEEYTCQLVFKVNNEIVSGLKFCRSVYRSGIRVDRESIMVGSYAPVAEPIVYQLEEDQVPSGMFARATYKSKIILIDDDKIEHASAEYEFKISKKW